MDAALLEVKNVRHCFRAKGRAVVALDGVSLDVKPSETVALVGESGSGKTTLAKCVLRIHKPTSGTVLFRCSDVATLAGGELRRFRRSVQYVFQNPFGSLNPSMTVFQNIARGMLIHGRATRAGLRGEVAGYLEVVNLSPEHADRFPNELSGGQRQRVAIARALAVQPELVILDEPTSSLDVSVQAQILNLLIYLQASRGYAYLFITHNLAVARHMSDRIAILYFGRLLEIGNTEEIFDHPAHPYTHALFSAIPLLGVTGLPLVGQPPLVAESPVAPVAPVAAEPPLVGSRARPAEGCRFAPRCTHKGRDERCYVEEPVLTALGNNHLVACHHAAG